MLERLNALPVSSFHYKLLVVAGIGWVFDSMDTGLIAFVLPLLIKEWGLSATQAGMLGSIGLVGMALGAVAAGTLADRVGRKTVFSVTIVLYSLATGLCAVAPNYELLVLFRFLVGLGLGGELPVAATLVTEYVPGRARGRFSGTLGKLLGRRLVVGSPYRLLYYSRDGMAYGLSHRSLYRPYIPWLFVCTYPNRFAIF